MCLRHSLCERHCKGLLSLQGPGADHHPLKGPARGGGIPLKFLQMEGVLEAISLVFEGFGGGSP